MAIVHRLSEADHIVVLGKNGQILEQGSYNSLAISGDYVQSLARGPESRQTDKATGSHIQAQVHPVAPMPQVAVTDSSRQNGDWKIYVYYSKSLGLLGLAAFALLVAVECALFVVQCKFLRTGHSHMKHADDQRLMGKLVGRE